MGQKTHPIGLRVGIYRKWAVSWYSQINEKTPRQFSFHNQSNKSYGKIVSRGGIFHSIWHDTWIKLFSRYSFTKFSRIRRILLINISQFKTNNGHIYFFCFYIKLMGPSKHV